MCDICLTSTSNKSPLSTTHLTLLSVAVHVTVRVPEPRLTHCESTLANSFALVMICFSSSLGGVECIIRSGVESGLKNCGVDLSCTAEHGAGDEQLGEGEPNQDLSTFTIFRCLIISSLARLIPVLGGDDRAALRIFRWLRISSLARLIIVDADAVDVDGEGKVAAFMMLVESVAILAIVLSHLITSRRERNDDTYSLQKLRIE